MSELHKILFEGLPVRASLVRLDSDWQEILKRRQHASDWTPPVKNLLGQMAAATLLMQSRIKFDGALLMQIQGDGPLKMVVAEAHNDFRFRVTASLHGAVAPEADLQSMCNIRGRGRCALTLDPQQRLPGQQPYQSLVALHDGVKPLENLAEVIEHYMLQSEQLETKLVLAANEEVAAGLLVQRLPITGENNLQGQQRAYSDADLEKADEDYHRIATLAASLTAEELLSLDCEKILHRLFWQEPSQRFAPERPQFACTCSRARVSDMVRGLGEAEAQDIIAERGSIDVDCEFCGAHYGFDAVEAAQLFTDAVATQASGSVH